MKTHMIQTIRNQGVAAYTFGVIAVAVLTILTLFSIEAVAPFSNSTDRANAWVCLSMTATPSTVQEGESTTLRWNFGGEQGVTVTIDQLPGQVFQGGSGSVVVTPTKTTEYRAVAHMEGNPITFDCCVVVTVIPATDPCEFVDLAIDEKSFTFTGPPALSHYTAKFCDGSTSGKVVGDWSDNETISFQKELKYVSVKADECVLEKQRECTPPAPDPWCEMTVSPTTIQQGSSAVLSWDSEGIQYVDIPGIGTGLSYTGTQTVSPATTTTYTGGFKTSVGSSTIYCDATVTVTPKPIDPDPWCEMNVAPQTIQKGDSAVLSWDSDEVTSVDIPGVGTNLLPADSKNISPATTTTYVGTFHTKEDGTISCDATVTVTEKPVDPDPWCDMNVAPSLIYEGESATLSWTSEYVTSVDIAGIGNSLAASSSANVSPATTTTYTGIFHTEKGSTISCDATVEVIPEGQDPEPICAMSISPSTVKSGDTATLTWETENTVSGSIDNGIGDVESDGTQTVTVHGDTTYTGVWRDAEGTTVVCSASVSIRRGGGSCLNCGDDDDDDEDEEEDDPKEPSIVLGKNITKTGSFITLNQVPYTGFEATPAMTALFWITVLAVSGLIAYVLTRVRLLERIRMRFVQSTIPEERHYLDYAQAQATPSPYANELTTVHSTIAPHDKPTDITEQIEDIAHGESVLLSPEALRIIRTRLEENGVDVTAYLEEVFEKAKAEFPREDGWILLSKERTEQLLYGTAREETPVSTGTNTKRTQIHADEREVAQDVSAQNNMLREHVSSLQSSHPVSQTVVNNHTNNVVARFIQNLVHVEKKEAFDLLRSISNKGVDVGVFMTLVVRQLDEVYKDRIEGNRSPDAELVKKTASWSTDDFETILGILVECVDYSYSNNRIGTKIALAKAFEHFEKK